MKIVAKRGDAFLVELEQGKGFMVDERNGKSEEMEVDAFLKFGYWYPLDEGEEIPKKVMEILETLEKK